MREREKKWIFNHFPNDEAGPGQAEARQVSHVDSGVQVPGPFLGAFPGTLQDLKQCPYGVDASTAGQVLTYRATVLVPIEVLYPQNHRFHHRKWLSAVLFDNYLNNFSVFNYIWKIEINYW